MRRPAPDVLLVSNDAELRALVDSRRPPAATIAYSDRSKPLPEDFQQIWVDLDEGWDPTLLDFPTDAVSVVFSSDVATLHRASSRAPTMLKPCAAERIDQLWAAVRPSHTAPTAPPTTSPHVASDPLPGWLTELLEIDLRSLSGKICTLIPQRLGYANGSLYIHEPNSRALVLAACNHSRPLVETVGLHEAGVSLMASVARLRRPRQADTAAQLRAELGVSTDSRHAYPDEGCLIAPLISHDKLLGVLNLSGRVSAAEQVTGPARDVVFKFAARMLEHALLHQQVQTEARVDGLTGLYNHRGMQEMLGREIRRAQRYGGSLSLLLLDLDGLKGVNDAFGHAAGDALLQHVAKRISGVLRQFDSAARVGGDEFLVLLPSTALAGAWHVAQRLLASIRAEAATYEGHALPITASVGVSEWTPGLDACKLIDMADRAMYCAKVAGGDRVTGPSTTNGLRQVDTAARSVRARLPAKRSVNKR